MVQSVVTAIACRMRAGLLSLEKGVRARRAAAARERGAQLTRRILSFARVQTLDWCPVSVSALLENTIELGKPVLGAGGEMSSAVEAETEFLVAGLTSMKWPC